METILKIEIKKYKFPNNYYGIFYNNKVQYETNFIDPFLDLFGIKKEDLEKDENKIH